ncbi:expressed hypothetical protein [Trichoplax adhaerens]|uniref:Vesicle transport protein n=1 Tax=Trichoplax adhaerens TaxID=10228 RepID=B3RXS5_TRIAD|nr:expressed hypothetical protein [Trichoplax adhaerens]EDV24908.1 expressed hypothetical protein [Trichoplax adhaerens]|eukprot:XP_002112798.1 expressed hypothetical protein [Trichoplax adhaerens]
MDKLKGLVGGQKEEEPSLLAQVSDASTLSWSTRIKGFGICFGLGVLLSIIGSIMLFFGNLTAFAFLYSFGNILSIASTVFLMGPVKQIKRMLDPNRLIATCLVFLFLGLTLCAALWWKKAFLALIFCICQYLAMTWYCLSYIPYARSAVTGCFKSCCNV